LGAQPSTRILGRRSDTITKIPQTFSASPVITYSHFLRPPDVLSRENIDMVTSRQNRKERRAAERAAEKLQISDTALSAKAARSDEAAYFSEPKTQQNGPAERAAGRLQANDYSQNAIEQDPTPPVKPQLEQLADQSQLNNGITADSAPSSSRLAANRANAQLSTGPKTEDGKAKSAKNALKTALTGRTVLLPDDDADRYERHLRQYRKAYEPVGERECELVQSLADTTWRVDRIPGLEEALYVKGANELAATVAELDPRARASMLRLQTYLVYERQFRNLHIQEMRLHRLREKLIAEIKQLQKEREQKEKDDLALAAKLYVAAKQDRKPFRPEEYGFEFSTQDVEGYLLGQRASFLTEKALQARP
jgi:hypothetical protein